ncbi:MAG: hypothetical protein WCH57_06080 [Verrucomicrobiota bacterium]
MDRKLEPFTLLLAPAACGWRAATVPERGVSSARTCASFAEAVAHGYALAAQERLGKHGSLPITVALPLRCAVFERMALPSADPGELSGMVRLHYEKSLPYPAEETATGFQVLARQPREAPPQTTLLAWAVHQSAAAALCAPLLERQFPRRLTLWAMHLAAQAPTEEPVCALWREEADRVFGIFEDRRVSFAEVLHGGGNLAAELPRVLLRAAMAGAPTAFHAVLLDGAFAPLGEALAAALHAPVAALPDAAGLPPEQAPDFTPEAWRTEQTRRGQSRRLRHRVLAGLTAYAALLLACLAALGMEGREREGLAREAAALHPRADGILARQTRWNALAPAVEPRRSTLELLFQICRSLPSPDTRITQCNLAPDQCVVEGEAPGARQAIAFAENLKTRPELAGFHFESDPPVLLPNEHAQFRIFGKP